MFSCVHAHTMYQTPPAQQTRFTYFQICVLAYVYILGGGGVCVHVCACLHTHAYTYITNVHRQAGEQSAIILIQMKISWKTIEFQYKRALKHIYSLSKINTFLLLFQ